MEGLKEIRLFIRLLGLMYFYAALLATIMAVLCLFLSWGAGFDIWFVWRATFGVLAVPATISLGGTFQSVADAYTHGKGGRYG